MKVITVKQPFASLIAAGLKEYEFRNWKTNYRGEIYIHAGLTVDEKAMKKFENYHLDYPTGVIMAKAELVDCIKVDEKFRNVLQEKNLIVYSGIIKDNTFNGYGFQLINIKKIKPILTKGKLSIWNYEPEDWEE